MALLLASAMHGARDLLEAGKFEEAKGQLNAAIAEMDKSTMANGDQVTALFFGNRKKE